MVIAQCWRQHFCFVLAFICSKQLSVAMHASSLVADANCNSLDCHLSLGLSLDSIHPSLFWFALIDKTCTQQCCTFKTKKQRARLTRFQLKHELYLPQWKAINLVHRPLSNHHHHHHHSHSNISFSCLCSDEKCWSRFANLSNSSGFQFNLVIPVVFTIWCSFHKQRYRYLSVFSSISVIVVSSRMCTQMKALGVVCRNNLRTRQTERCCLVSLDVPKVVFCLTIWMLKC